MSEIYRFRSINQLIKYKELEDFYCFFSDVKNFNDPMEGYFELEWYGDSILWSNFFKHYVMCLGDFYLQACFIKGNCKMSADFIDIDIYDKSLLTSLYNDLLNRTINRLFKNTKIRQVFDVFNSWILDKNALLYYLEIMQPIILEEIMNQFEKAKILPNPSINYPTDYDIIIPKQQKGTKISIPEEVRIELMSKRLEFRYKLKDEEVANLELFIMFYTEYPGMYLNRLTDLVKPNAYMTCFSKTYSNSAMWGHYADNHKGVCLIFDHSLIDSFKENIIDVEGFYETQYSSKVIPLNFFLLIRYDDDHLDFWYKDSKNNKKCFLYDRRFNKDWIKDYGDLCKSIYTKKTIDWVYEEEARAIIFDHNYQFYDDKTRKVFYVPNKLKGIIFGHNTSISDKLRVLNILKNKKLELNNQFKIYQAYFSKTNEETKINIHQVNIDF